MIEAVNGQARWPARTVFGGDGEQFLPTTFCIRDPFNTQVPKKW
jgi:hypothetical protein